MNVEANAEFRLDFADDMLYSRFSYVGKAVYQNLSLGKRLEFDRNPLDCRVSILRPEDTLRHDEIERFFTVRSNVPTPPGGAMVIRRQSREDGNRSLASDIFDPRVMLEVGHRKIWKLLEISLSFHLDGQIKFRKEVIGEEQILRWTQKAGTKKSMTFREYQGRLLLHEYVTETAAGQSMSETYVYATDEESGVIYPCTYHRATNNADGPQYSRVITVTSTSFDMEIPQAVFSYSAFGIKDGDQLYDEMEKESLVFFNGTAVKPDVYMSRVKTP